MSTEEQKSISRLNSVFFQKSGNVLYLEDLKGTKELINILNKSSFIYIKNIYKINDIINSLIKKIEHVVSLKEIEPEKIKNEIKKITRLLVNNAEAERHIGGIHWMILTKTAGYANCLTEYIQLREIAKRVFQNNKKPNNDVMRLYRIRALLEDRDNLDLNMHSENIFFKEFTKNASLYTKIKVLNANMDNVKSQQDISFHNYIKNKRVAIVGPAESHLELGSEIDGFDIVVRLNQVDFSSYPQNKFGTKRNIIYFANSVLMQKIDSIKSEVSDIEFICYSTYDKDVLVKVLLENKFRPIKYHERACNPYLFGCPSAIQRAIFDILKCDPSYVKIFNTNLWLDIRKNKYYIYQQRFSTGNITIHDVLSDFVFTKRMHSLGLIDVDDVLKSILNMTLTEYANTLIGKYD